MNFPWHCQFHGNSLNQLLNVVIWLSMTNSQESFWMCTLFSLHLLLFLCGALEDAASECYWRKRKYDVCNLFL